MKILALFGGQYVFVSLAVKNVQRNVNEKEYVIISRVDSMLHSWQANIKPINNRSIIFHIVIARRQKLHGDSLKCK